MLGTYLLSTVSMVELFCLQMRSLSHHCLIYSLYLRTPMNIVKNILAFGEFYSMENDHSVNLGKFIGQNSVLNEKIKTFIEQSFILETP